MTASAGPDLDFSLLTPTRGRPERLERLLESLADTTHRPDRLEVVLGLDADDPHRPPKTYPFPVVVAAGPPNRTMGQLNLDGFRASRGRWIMLLNDDVVVRTPNWDERLREMVDSLPDGVALLHVNDLIFRARLCTFPMVSRAVFEAIGGDLARFRRYRIDDHLYDVFALLGLLGRERIHYLPGVVFEHEHIPGGEGTPHANVFQSPDRRTYFPSRDLVDEDEQTFVSLLPARMLAAARLAVRIDPALEEQALLSSLSSIQDSREARRPLRVRRIAPESARPLAPSDVHLVVAGNGEVAQDADLAGAGAIDLLGGPGLDHASTFDRLNEILATTPLPAVLVLNGRCRVASGSVGGLLGSLDPKVALLTFAVLGPSGAVVDAGRFVRAGPFRAGFHRPDQVARGAVASIGLGGALLDRRKIGFLPFDPSLPPSARLVDLSLKVWEQGYEVGCDPALVLRSDEKPRDELDREATEALRQRWLASGRLDKLARRTWIDARDFRP